MRKNKASNNFVNLLEHSNWNTIKNKIYNEMPYLKLKDNWEIKSLPENKFVVKDTKTKKIIIITLKHTELMPYFYYEIFPYIKGTHQIAYTNGHDLLTALAFALERSEYTEVSDENSTRQF